MLVGRTLRAARGGPGTARVSLLAGRQVEAVEARGKHVFIAVSGGLTLHTHLGMHGSWHRYRPGERWLGRAADAVAVLEVAEAVAVCFRAPTVQVIETRALSLHPVVSRLGPDLLEPAPDLEEAVRRLRDPGRAQVAIGDALLDQGAQAGLGNVYRSEVCFVESVDPFVPVGAVDDATLRRLLARARYLLAANAESPFRTTVPDALGSEPGRAGPPGTRGRGGRLWVYRRTGLPCRRCGSPVRSASVAARGRRVYWCPACQRPGAGARSAV